MAKKKSDKPAIMFTKGPRGLSPATAYDQEELERFPVGTSFEVKPMDARGHDQLGFYWTVLNRVVKATDLWPTAEHLHDAIKRELGYLTISYDMLGKPRVVVDSIALEKMGDNDRSDFIEKAFGLLAEKIGVDPVSLIPERQAA
jgi:hypothetical protein